MIHQYKTRIYKDGIPPHKKRCVNCKYSATMHASKKQSSLGSVYCDYIGLTGNRRPCPASECTVFEPKVKKRRGKEFKFR